MLTSFDEFQKEKMKRNMFDVNFYTVIYRIFKIERLLEVFNKEQLTLVKPKLWDDPFENYLLKAECIDEKGVKISLEELQEALYGQCWTSKSEADWMWRAYTPNKNGVKVKTTVGKLLNEINRINEESQRLDYFIGKVKYYKEKEIKELFNNPNNVEEHLLDPTGEKIQNHC